MIVCKNIKSLNKVILKNKNNGNSIGFIPTMGALHKGHLSLIQQARSENDFVVVSIFVNPKQFTNLEDLQRYPRTIEQDIALIKETVDILFIPDAEEMYPEGFGTSLHIHPLAVTGEGVYRPGHFNGMATVVLKFFHLIQPTKAYFGKKDYQQYLIVKQLVRDLNIPTSIVGGETIREENGLAMSSRNMRLSLLQQQKAAVLFEALKSGQAKILSGEHQSSIIKKTIEEIIAREGEIVVEYIEIRQISDFAEADIISEDAVLLVAAYLGGVRLIDNIEVFI